MSDEEMPASDIIPLCKQILQELLGGKTPEEVQVDLTMQGVSAEDGESLINVSVASAQTVSPIMEEGGTAEQAIEALIAQGMEEALAQQMVQMLGTLMDGAEEPSGGAEQASEPEEQPEQELDEERLKAIFRLAIAVDSDLTEGVDKQNIQAAISNISDIRKYPEVAADVMEFIENVRLARSACNKSLENNDLQGTMAQMGLNRRPPYVAMLAVFFNRGAAGV